MPIERAFKEKLETIIYSPGAQGNSDLEAGTNTITATSKGAADYTQNHTIPVTGDSRLTVEQVNLTLTFTIDSMTATQLDYDVEVGGTTRLTGNVASTGTKLDQVNITVPAQLTLGVATAIDIHFWVDSGNAVLSMVKVISGVGSPVNTNPIINLAFSGMAKLVGGLTKVGTGTITAYVGEAAFDAQWSDCEYFRAAAAAPNFRDAVNNGTLLVSTQLDIRTGSSVATDAVYITTIGFILRRML